MSHKGAQAGSVLLQFSRRTAPPGAFAGGLLARTHARTHACASMHTQTTARVCMHSLGRDTSVRHAYACHNASLRTKIQESCRWSSVRGCTNFSPSRLPVRIYIGILHVTVHRIEGFSDTAGFMDKTDPYVQLTLGKEKRKTRCAILCDG